VVICKYKHTISDENRRKRTGKLFLYFLAETGSGSENAGLETESGYVDARKRTNTDGELKN
jgi:hypothetical protein